MTPDERERLRRYLFHYWFDRPKDDEEIVREFLSTESREGVMAFVSLIEKFASLEESAESKAEFIRATLRRYFAAGAEAPLKWLQSIGEMVERGSVKGQ